MLISVSLVIGKESSLFLFHVNALWGKCNNVVYVGEYIA